MNTGEGQNGDKNKMKNIVKNLESSFSARKTPPDTFQVAKYDGRDIFNICYSWISPLEEPTNKEITSQAIEFILQRKFTVNET